MKGFVRMLLTLMLVLGLSTGASALDVDDFSTGYFLLESFGSVVSDTVPCPSCISPSRHVTLTSNLPQQLSIAMLDQGEAVCVFSQGGGQLGLVYDLDTPVNLGAEGNQVSVTLSVSEPGAGVTLTLGDGEKHIQSQSMATVGDGVGPETILFDLYFFTEVNLGGVQHIEVTLDTPVGGDFNVDHIGIQEGEIEMVDWSDSFALRASGGFENPLSHVAFNPQPEPPHDPFLDLSDPMRPRITVMGDSDDMFRILFALDPLSEGPFLISASGTPDPAGHFEFDVFHFDVFRSPGRPPFTFWGRVLLDIRATGTGVPAPGSWRMFNPQPEPPHDPLFPGQMIGFDFQFQFHAQGDNKAREPVEVDLTFQIIEGDIIFSFEEVCIDLDEDGWGIPGSDLCDNAEPDCDDNNSSANPGNVESSDMGNCSDGIDNDCDGLADDDPECGSCFISTIGSWPSR